MYNRELIILIGVQIQICCFHLNQFRNHCTASWSVFFNVFVALLHGHRINVHSNVYYVLVFKMATIDKFIQFLFDITFSNKNNGKVIGKSNSHVFSVIL